MAFSTSFVELVVATLTRAERSIKRRKRRRFAHIGHGIRDSPPELCDKNTASSVFSPTGGPFSLEVKKRCPKINALIPTSSRSVCTEYL